MIKTKDKLPFVGHNYASKHSVSNIYWKLWTVDMLFTWCQLRYAITKKKIKSFVFPQQSLCSCFLYKCSDVVQQQFYLRFYLPFWFYLIIPLCTTDRPLLATHPMILISWKMSGHEFVLFLFSQRVLIFDRGREGFRAGGQKDFIPKSLFRFAAEIRSTFKSDLCLHL